MKHTKKTRPKHTVKFIRVLNQPATWIEVDVIESAETDREKLLSQLAINKPVPHLLK
jgi:hypothetical protein